MDKYLESWIRHHMEIQSCKPHINETGYIISWVVFSGSHDDDHVESKLGSPRIVQIGPFLATSIMIVYREHIRKLEFMWYEHVVFYNEHTVKFINFKRCTTFIIFLLYSYKT